MQCRGCKREWGEVAWPLQVSYHSAWKYIPTIGYEKHGDSVIFEYDYDDEQDHLGEAADRWYECNQCGELIYEDELITILDYINGGINGNKEVEMS